MSEFYRPNEGDVAVVLPQQTQVSLAALAAAGIDTTSPFLVWADHATISVFALQKPEHREADPERFFRGLRPVTGHMDLLGELAEAEEAAYEKGWQEGHQDAQHEAQEEAYENERQASREREAAYEEGYKAGAADAAAKAGPGA